MKLLDPRSVFLGLLGLMTVYIVPVQAQMGAGASPMPGLDSALRAIFGNEKAFSTAATMEIKGGGQDMDLKVNVSVLDGMTKTDMDMADIKGGVIPAQAMAQIKSLKMDKITTLIINDGNTSVVIYPGMKSYVETPTSGVQDAGECSLEVTKTSDDEIDGKKLVKKEVNVNCKSFEQQKFTLWSEASRPAMPVRLVTEQKGVTLTMTLSDVKMEKPDANDFVPPADFLKFNSMPELLGHVQKQMLEQLSK